MVEHTDLLGVIDRIAESYLDTLQGKMHERGLRLVASGELTDEQIEAASVVHALMQGDGPVAFLADREFQLEVHRIVVAKLLDLQVIAVGVEA